MEWLEEKMYPLQQITVLLSSNIQQMSAPKTINKTVEIEELEAGRNTDEYTSESQQHAPSPLRELSTLFVKNAVVSLPLMCLREK